MNGLIVKPRESLLRDNWTMATPHIHRGVSHSWGCLPTPLNLRIRHLKYKYTPLALVTLQIGYVYRSPASSLDE